MTVKGKCLNGAVVLDEPLALPDGTEVEVLLPLENNGATKTVLENPPFLELIKWVETQPCTLPVDLAKNHDHYLYGTAKRP